MSSIKSKKVKRLKFLGLLAILGLATLSSIAVGFPGYKSQLPDSGITFDCETCHEGQGGPLNGFGEDFQANGNKYNSTLGSIDSDGDNYTNDEEFNAEPVTNPGNASSHPIGTVIPPQPRQWDLIPWLLTIITGVVLIIGVSVILVLIATNKKLKREDIK